jgi:hypothetical protein
MTRRIKHKCPKCGHNRFLATQRVSGTIEVVVTLHGDRFSPNTTPEFLANNTADGKVDAQDLEFDNPQAPFQCARCKAAFTPVSNP